MRGGECKGPEAALGLAWLRTRRPVLLWRPHEAQAADRLQTSSDKDGESEVMPATTRTAACLRAEIKTCLPF